MIRVLIAAKVALIDVALVASVHLGIKVVDHTSDFSAELIVLLLEFTTLLIVDELVTTIGGLRRGQQIFFVHKSVHVALVVLAVVVIGNRREE